MPRVDEAQLRDYLNNFTGDVHALASDLRDAREEIRGIRGNLRADFVKLVRISEPFMEQVAAQALCDEFGFRYTAAWGEPDRYGVYNPQITRHAPDENPEGLPPGA